MGKVLPFQNPKSTPTGPELAAAWLKSRHAVLAKAPDWKALPDEGKAKRMRGLIDDEARAMSLDTMPDEAWVQMVRQLDDLAALRF